jgi:hypothetical protein
MEQSSTQGPKGHTFRAKLHLSKQKISRCSGYLLTFSVNDGIFLAINSQPFSNQKPNRHTFVPSAMLISELCLSMNQPNNPIFIQPNSTNYCPKWCLLDVKTALIIVANGVYLLLKQVYLLHPPVPGGGSEHERSE